MDKNVVQFFITCKRTNNANNAIHYAKLGKKRPESSERNYYIISPRVIIKAIIIISFHNVFILPSLSGVTNLSLPSHWCLCSLHVGNSWHTDVSKWSGGQPWWLLPFHCRRHCWCAHTSAPATIVLLSRPFIICSLYLIAVLFLQAIWLLEWSCNCHHFSPFMSPRDVQVVQLLP